jgi:DNA-binding response OmpR family regulator
MRNNGAGDEKERPARVLVVDDEEIIVEMLTMGLNYEGFEVSVARTGFEALEQARSAKPDIVVLDVMLPGIDGVEVCRRLRAAGDVGILMLTARGEVEDRVMGLDSGADDYLVKPFTFRELLARVGAILRRKGVNLQQALRVGDLVLDRQTRRVTRGGRPVELTPREFDMLELFLSHPRQVFSREVILNRVWGYDYFGDTNVIDVHIRHLREKLDDENRDLIRSVRGVGYSLEPPDVAGETSEGPGVERAGGPATQRHLRATTGRRADVAGLRTLRATGQLPHTEHSRATGEDHQHDVAAALPGEGPPPATHARIGHRVPGARVDQP